MSAGLVVGVDVGGTFTDVFVLDASLGACYVAKVPTSRPDPSLGVIHGIEQAIEATGNTALIVHGTTIGTNALLERRGARTGVITTAGFRDVLEMRRRDRPHTWGLWGMFEPLVTREFRLEVKERTLADGTVDRATDSAEVEAAAHTLLQSGCEALAIVFINAYANADNERIASEAVRAMWPNAHVSVSHEILPEIREFERTSTTTLNAVLQPVVSRYLERLERGLRSGGFTGEMLIVQSNGGVMSVETARRFPVRTALSGPAAGVIAARAMAAQAGFDNVITCDMGGTSFDVSLVANGASVLAAQTSIEFGLTIRTPMIEITTIGAGGGSIAAVDRGGLLQVGPDSAGSHPGPACYGFGNDRPTVTDANVLLGRIDAERPIGGALARLDIDAARAAISQHVAVPLGLDVMSAAEAIIKVANARMAGAIRLVSIERGHDPRQFSLLSFGGGGGLHAGALLREVGLARALVPRYPGVTSAIGCTIADLRHDRVETLNVVLDDLDTAALAKRIADAIDVGRDQMQQIGSAIDFFQAVVELDMLYLGQTHTVDVQLPVDINDAHSPLSSAQVQAAFEARYRALYGRLLEGLPIRVLNLRTTVIGVRPTFDVAALRSPVAVGVAHKVERAVWLKGEMRNVPVFDRGKLVAGNEIEGPAIFEQPDTTVWLDPGLIAQIDDDENIIMSPLGECA